MNKCNPKLKKEKRQKQTNGKRCVNVQPQTTERERKGIHGKVEMDGNEKWIDKIKEVKKRGQKRERQESVGKGTKKEKEK